MTDPEPPGTLEALTIVELSESVAGAYAGKLFAQFGARVIKIESPEKGHELRSAENAHLVELNPGKLSLTLDYGRQAGAEVLSRLLEDADGLIEDWPSRRAADLGLGDAETLLRVPRLVIAGIDSGLDAAQTSEAFEALGPRAAEKTGLHAFVAMLSALWYASQTEHGQVMRVSGLEALTSTRWAIDDRWHETRIEMSPTVLTSGQAPALGEHTDSILADILTLSPSEIEQLRTEHII